MKKTLFLALFMALSNYMLAQTTFTLKSKNLGGIATTTEEFNSFGCSGKNQSPQLSWVNAPQGTKSFAITMYDPDAPTGSGWWHWVAFDIPANTTELKEGAGNPKLNLMPKGSIQTLINGVKGYSGPCPPKGHGYHQYIITIHALKTDKLGLDENADSALVGYHLWENTLAKATIVTYYKREK